MTTTEIKVASDETLRMWARNARATYVACAGHDKAERNKNALQLYQSEMMARNMPDWGSNLCGIFNGPGSL